MTQDGDAARSRTGEAYRRLRAAIVLGELAPGARLGPGELARRFGFGPTPVREALSSLAAENLAVAIEQRGFRVAPLSSGELRELLSLRHGFEREAMLRSMQEGGPEWEAGVVSAHHLLSLTAEPRVGAAPAEIADWSRRHDAFHEAIIAGYDGPWLRRFHRASVAQIERYRMAILRNIGSMPERSEAVRRNRRILSHREHALLRDAVLSRDAAEAEARLADHIGETAEVFVALFERVSVGLTDSAAPRARRSAAPAGAPAGGREASTRG